jgi:para-nitrobenzyl esterase
MPPAICSACHTLEQVFDTTLACQGFRSHRAGKAAATSATVLSGLPGVPACGLVLEEEDAMSRWSRLVARTAGPIALAPLVLAASPALASSSHVVTTDRGAVKGATSNGVERFLGIPYAAAPTGALRWKAPRPAAPWAGVRNATSFGNPCPVLVSTNGPRSETEDCLVINVWRPAGTPANKRLPVHVFIHGGGLVNGSGAQNDESKLVRQTGVIGVSFNYRLGVLGFLRTPGLATEGDDAGNYGFLDQQAALHWVQRNIASFGGLPTDVTIDGESAGGWSVCGHLVAPSSSGLFEKAMMQSGSCYSQTPARAEQRGEAFATAAGCTDPATQDACLRSAPVGKLLDASNGFSPAFVSGTLTFPEPLNTAVNAGRFQRVPLLIGSNRDEGRTFAQGFIGADRTAYEGFVSSTFGARASDVLQHYPWPAKATKFTAAYLIGAIETDGGLIAGIGGCTNRNLTRTLAKYTRTYAYEFDNRTGPGLTPIPGYVWGAGHAAELAYIWPSFNNGTSIAARFNAADRKLANQMTEYWGAFTKHGGPDVAGMQDWPRFASHGLTLSLRTGGSKVVTYTTYNAEHQCSFWSTMPPLDLTA